MNLLAALGLGRLPHEAYFLASPDTFVITLEHIWASITFREFSRGSGYSAWRRKWFAASLGVTTQRLIAYRGRSRLINVPYSDPRFTGLDFSKSDDQTIDIIHDASLFHPTWSGKLQYRFRTTDAKIVVANIVTCVAQAEKLKQGL